MFKPGTLVKLAAGYEQYLGWSGSEFWMNQSHVGMFIGPDYDPVYVRILIDDQIILIYPKALQKY
jgi:hypothetical protein